MMPKAKGDPYFISARQGAEAAAKALGVELLWDGPTDLDPAKQNEVVEAWITRGVDAIAVSVENRAAISTVLRKARGRGIKVVTWDADAEPDARDFFVNQATAAGNREHAHRRGGAHHGWQGRVRDHHRESLRRESERVDQVHQAAARREVSASSGSSRSSRATATGTAPSPKRRPC